VFRADTLDDAIGLAAEDIRFQFLDLVKHGVRVADNKSKGW
jgi:hypothetical protein